MASEESERRAKETAGEPEKTPEEPAQGSARDSSFRGERGDSVYPEQRRREPADEPPQPVDVWALLHYCFLLLHSHAWQSMGLLPNPATGRTEKHLEQARVAIDAAAGLAGQLEQKLTGAQLREVRSLLSDLRLNFVQQQKAEGV